MIIGVAGLLRMRGARSDVSHDGATVTDEDQTT